jgi:hypothetical protein
MKMLRQSLLAMLLVLVSSCSQAPFQSAPLAPLDAADPDMAVKRFSAAIPDTFQLLNTIVFNYHGKQFSGIGYIGVQQKEQAFTVVCMNQMGVKLFEISGKRDAISANFVIDEFKKKGNVAAAVGNDIRHIYFDLVPSPDAVMQKRRYEISFREPSGQGVMEFVFAGEMCALVKKTYYEDGSPVYRISYYEYQYDKGRLYPGGIVLENFKYGYSLIARLKEICA